MSTHFKIDYNGWSDEASPIKDGVKIKSSHRKLVAGALISERNKDPKFREKVGKGISKYHGSIEERFLNKLKKLKNGCIEYPNRWIGCKEKTYQPKEFAVIYYKLGFTKQIIWQTCRNKKCVNPNHLIEMSKEEQALDTVSKRKVLKGDSHHQSKLSEKDIKDIIKLYKSLLKERKGKSNGIASIIHKQYNQVSLTRICQIIKSK